MPDHLAPDTPEQIQAEQAILAAQNIQQVIATSMQQLATPDPDSLPGEPMGKIVYQSIQANPNLTEQEKHAATCEVGRQIVTNEAQAAIAAGQSSIFLRNTTAGVRFLTSAMQDKGERYINAVKDQALEIGRQNRLVANPDLKDAAAGIVSAINDNKHQLSNDACSFMRACAQGVPDNLNNGVNTLMANALVLTTAGPAITKATMNDVATSQSARAAFQANKSALQYVSALSDNSAATYAPAMDMQQDAAVDTALKAALDTTFQQLAIGDTTALRAGAPQHNRSVKEVLGRDDKSKLNAAEEKLQRRQQKLEDYTGRKEATDQQLQAKQQFAANVEHEPMATDDLRQKTQQGVAKLQQTSTRLGAKIQSQTQKVANTEQRVDQLRSRVNHH